MSLSPVRTAPRLTLALALGCACSSSSTKETAHDAAVRDARVDVHAHADAGDATVDAGLDAPMDVSLPDVNPCVPDGLNSPDVPVYPADAGATWSALYNDFFGPSGVASCSGTAGMCHGSTTAQGYTVSDFLCPGAGDASAACWKGLTAMGDAAPNLIGLPFDDGGLGTILCQNFCVGIMPEGCSYYFTDDDMARIQAWVEAGALDN